MLAVCFLLTGLASVGFPGTFGFLGTELLVDGAVQAYPYVGVAVVIAAALNGIAVVQAYFRLFTGTRHVTSVPLEIGMRERIAVLTLAALDPGRRPLSAARRRLAASRCHVHSEKSLAFLSRAANAPVLALSPGDHGGSSRPSLINSIRASYFALTF